GAGVFLRIQPLDGNRPRSAHQRMVELLYVLADRVWHRLPTAACDVVSGTDRRDERRIVLEAMANLGPGDLRACGGADAGRSLQHAVSRRAVGSALLWRRADLPLVAKPAKSIESGKQSRPNWAAPRMEGRSDGSWLSRATPFAVLRACHPS